jgi:hypothetical protein
VGGRTGDHSGGGCSIQFARHIRCPDALVIQRREGESDETAHWEDQKVFDSQHVTYLSRGEAKTSREEAGTSGLFALRPDLRTTNNNPRCSFYHMSVAFKQAREYKKWLDPTKSGEHYGFFWIKGHPGTGKSTLMKFAVEHVGNSLTDKITIFFFFNARGAQLEKSRGISIDTPAVTRKTSKAAERVRFDSAINCPDEVSMEPSDPPKIVKRMHTTT